MSSQPIMMEMSADGKIKKMDKSVEEWSNEIKESMDKQYLKYYQNEPKYPKTFLDVSDDTELLFNANPHYYDYSYHLRFDFKRKVFMFMTGGCQTCGDEYEGTFEYDDKTFTLNYLYQIDPYATPWNEKKNQVDETYEGIKSCYSNTIKGVLEVNMKQRFNYKLVKEVKEHYCGYGKDRTHLTLKIDKDIMPPYVSENGEINGENDLEVNEIPVFDEITNDPFDDRENVLNNSERVLYTYSISISDTTLDRYKSSIVNIWTMKDTFDIDEINYYKERVFENMLKEIKEKVPSFPITKLDLNFLKRIHDDENFLLCLYDQVYRKLFKEVRFVNNPVPIYAKNGDLILVTDKFKNYRIYSDGTVLPNGYEVLWIMKNGMALIINSTKPELVKSYFNWRENSDFSKWDKFFLRPYIIESINENRKTRDIYYDTNEVIPFIEFLLEEFK